MCYLKQGASFAAGRGCQKPRFAPFGKTHQSPLQFLFSIFGMGRKNKRAKSASKAREGKELKKIKTEEMEKKTSERKKQEKKKRNDAFFKLLGAGDFSRHGGSKTPIVIDARPAQSKKSFDE